MAVADGFLPRRRLVDGIQRQGDFYQLFAYFMIFPCKSG